MFKRLFDILVSLSALIFLSPVFLLLSILVRVKMGAPVFFAQTRPGLHSEPFVMYKFRSMSSASHVDGSFLPDAERLTSLGRFLRATSLDELPELWNVLKGDMSLVGPRPLLVEYLGLYSPQQSKRHDVRPGITGWAQVNGRNAISWDEKFELDVWYVDHQSFLLDFTILFLTVKTVFMRDGISAQGESTMERFTGREKGGDGL